MKKVQYLLLITLCFLSSAILGQQPLGRQFIITNRTGSTVKIKVAADANKPTQFLLADNQQRIVPIKRSVTTFEVLATEGVSRQMLSKIPYIGTASNYAQEVTQKMLNAPNQNVEVTILKEPVAGNVRPFRITVDSVQGRLKTEDLIPASGKVVDIFPLAAAAYKANPDAPINPLDILSSSKDDTIEEITANYNMLIETWKNSLNEVTKAEQFAFPHTVMNTLNDAYALVQLQRNPSRSFSANPEQELARRSDELQLRLKRALD